MPITTNNGTELLSGRGIENGGCLSSPSSALEARGTDLETPTGISVWVFAIMFVVAATLTLGELWWKFGSVFKEKIKAGKERKQKERQRRDLEAAGREKARAMSDGAETLVGSGK